MTNVALLSVQPVLAAGLQTVLSTEDDLSLCSTSASVAELLADLAAGGADLLLVEITPEISLDTLKRIRKAAAGAPVVLWADTVAVEFVSQVIGIGVRGILRKTLTVSQLTDCLRKVVAGELWIEKPLCDRLLAARRISLTPRERQLLALLAQGLKNKEIAHALDITEGTVKVYLSRLFQKVGANDRFDLALFALKNFAANPDFLDAPAGPAAGSGAHDFSARLEYLPNFVTLDRQVQ